VVSVATTETADQIFLKKRGQMIPVTPNRVSWRLGTIAATLAASLWLGACQPGSPKIPRLEFTLSVSVANDTTTIAEVASDRSEFLEISNDALGIKFSTEFGADLRQVVGDRLSVTPKSNSFSTRLGIIALPLVAVPALPPITLQQLVGDAVEITDGATIPFLPAQSISTELKVPLESVTSLVIESGAIVLAVTNTFPVALENVVFNLVDNGKGGRVVDTISMGTIAANGGSSTDSFDLAGATISGDLELGISAGTVSGTGVVIQGDPGIEFSLEVLPLAVSEATALIPQQEFSDDQSLDFPDDRIQVTEALISEGGLTLRVTNEIPLIMEIEFTLRDLQDPSGTPRTLLIDSLSAEPREITFDLTNNRFAPVDPLALQLSYAVRTLDTGDEVTIRSDGEITVQAITEALTFGRVAGILDNLELEIPEQTETVDFPQGLDNLVLAATDLAVYITSAVGFNSGITLDIRGINRSGQTGSLLIDEVFPAGNPDSPQSIVIRPESEDLTAFLNLLPTSITVTPSVFVGDGVSQEVIEPDHWVQVDSVQFGAPAAFQVREATQIQPDPVRRTFDDDTTRERISSNVRSATVRTTIENHIPLAVGVRLYVGETFETVYTNPTLVVPPLGEPAFGVEAAPYSGGSVSASSFNTQNVTLESDEILKLLEPVYYTGIQIAIDGTDGDVALAGSDFVIVQAGALIILELNEDLFD
jgi:hypothetical protein